MKTDSTLKKIWKIVLSGLVVGALAAIGGWISSAEHLSPLYAVVVVGLLKSLQKWLDSLYSGSILLNEK
jgi:hypothetical protein